MSISMYEKLQNVAKPYSVLYVEDDEFIQEAMKNILNIFTTTLYCASNGEEGIEIYEKFHPDLIITDISMPVLNGIEMIKAIRKVDKNIPIMVNSAFNDNEYLMEAIYLGVDRYTIKPIKHKEFLESLLFLFETLQNRDEAKKYEQIAFQEKLNSEITLTLKQLIEFYPHPTLIFNQKNDLKFANQSAIELFNLPLNLENAAKGSIESSFLKSDGCIHTFEQLDENSSLEKRIMVKTSLAKKIFIPLKSYIDSEEFEMLQIYAFTDITRLEYEKQKASNLSMYFRALLQYSQKENSQVKKYESTESITVKREVKEREKSYDEIRMMAMHPAEKIDAIAYANELNADIYDELIDLDEIEKDMKDKLFELENSFTCNSLHELAGLLITYSRTIGRLIDFEDIAFSVEKLANFLSSIENLDFKVSKMYLLLNALVEDLMQWRKMNFVTQESKDIHYLDASLLSSCLQIEREFSGIEEIEEDDELDIF